MNGTFESAGETASTPASVTLTGALDPATLIFDAIALLRAVQARVADVADSEVSDLERSEAVDDVRCFCGIAVGMLKNGADAFARGQA